ncbi:hypothetical protein [Bacteroides sp. 51]|uniref:hypothetical protein n=1 Tax=Bacteroides sp. 51 TaxID=2302938 RepID=UPI0013D2BCAA|nr:hypothetical protein [Bacteroides sp. 51]NDV83539.1 hypothetical protein [Bacteroides sp. 51]
MKRITILLLGTLCSILVYSQVPFSTYESVPRNGQQTTPQYQKKEVQFQTTAGYYYDSYSKDFKRIRIKINPVSNGYGGAVIYLRATYNSDYDVWAECNVQASKVEKYSDGDFFANRFEWKVQDRNVGTIYFNY